MKVQVDYSHYVIVDVPDSIIEKDENGEFDGFPLMFNFLKNYVPEGAEVMGWEYPVKEEE